MLGERVIYGKRAFAASRIRERITELSGVAVSSLCNPEGAALEHRFDARINVEPVDQGRAVADDFLGQLSAVQREECGHGQPVDVRSKGSILRAVEKLGRCIEE